MQEPLDCYNDYAQDQKSSGPRLGRLWQKTIQGVLRHFTKVRYYLPFNSMHIYVINNLCVPKLLYLLYVILTLKRVPPLRHQMRATSTGQEENYEHTISFPCKNIALHLYWLCNYALLIYNYFLWSATSNLSAPCYVDTTCASSLETVGGTTGQTPKT